MRSGIDCAEERTRRCATHTLLLEPLVLQLQQSLRHSGDLTQLKCCDGGGGLFGTHKIPFVTPSPVVYFLTCVRLFSWHGHEGKESSVHSKNKKKKKNPISNKTKVFVLGTFPLPAGGNLTNQMWLIIKTRKHLLYLAVKDTSSIDARDLEVI